MEDENKKNKRLCEGCTTCCRYVTVIIGKPKNREDIDEIEWYLLHENIAVYIDDEDDWVIELPTKCKSLGEDGLCNDYEARPSICREYTHDECERYGDGDYCKHIFRTRDDFLKFVREDEELNKIYCSDR